MALLGEHLPYTQIVTYAHIGGHGHARLAGINEKGIKIRTWTYSTESDRFSTNTHTHTHGLQAAQVCIGEKEL